MHDCLAEGHVDLHPVSPVAAVTYNCRCFRSQESVSMDNRKDLKYGIKRKAACVPDQPTDSGNLLDKRAAAIVEVGH